MGREGKVCVRGGGGGVNRQTDRKKRGINRQIDEDRERGGINRHKGKHTEGVR